MTDPSRWLDPSSDAPSGARQLLQQAPRVPALTPEARARMAARVAKVGIAGGAVAAGAWAWKGLFGVGVMGLATVVFVGVTRHGAPVSQPVHAPEVVAAPHVAAPAVPVAAPSAPVTLDVVAASAPPRVVQSPTPAPVVRPAPSAHVVSANAARGNTDDEMTLLGRAQYLATREPSAALVLVQDHATRFPRGQQVEERERIAVNALVHAGRAQEARARGEAFLRRYPGSIYATPIRDQLRTLP